ncbi:baseplate wedge subunit [Pelagibacter phage HTVC008M]|jgi:hypothetical protein|uniref:baseplate wedge subunit n=1 Tax=Pelagibacter phage HTVC008M TaxID=1283076 RepID=UPI0002B27B99|nr:baseplate wedge subunit [Pelagibacter phage HTVC008M]AGE60388.1 baseplate wedge [Pelagibacter phage HTVC008M]
MATNKKLEVTDLDFDTIKTNLKKFLRQQDQFTDYDFEGSTISSLLDVLAYNTHYNGVYANVLANEMFLDSADMRNSIVSHAKHVGYTPRSATAPYADVDLVVNNATGATLTAAQGTTFTSTVDGVSYNYIVKEDTTTTPVDGVYTFKNLNLYEGTLVTNKYTVNTADANQRFLIKNDMADTTTLLVKVQNSSSDTTTTTYVLSTDLVDVSSTSTVYFLEGAEDEQYEVIFGDGVLGKALSTGNIVSLTYIVTNGSDSNGASSFALSGNVGGFTDVSLTVNTNSVNGADPESPASIRFNAPKQYATQNRAVTAKDYESKVKSIYSNAKSVQVWGGEDNETPVYGRVYISINPVAGATLTEATKSDIITQLKNFNVASITPVIENPETTFIQPTVTVRYDAKSTTNTAESIKSLVQTAITNFNTDNLQEFDQVFRHSKFIETVNKADDSILSNITTLKLHKAFTATVSSSTTYTISFNNALYNPHSGHNSDMGGILSSSSFKVSGDTTNDYFLNDDGQGNIRLYYVAGGVNVYTNNTQGTINYTTGKITLNSLHISEVGNVDGATSTTIRLTVVPNSVDVVPVRNQVIQIDETNATVVVTADDYDTTSGIGYTTATNYAS